MRVEGLYPHLVPDTLERAFRLERIEADRNFLGIVLPVLGLAFLTVVPLDFRLSSGTERTVALTARLCGVAVAFASLAVLQKVQRTPQYDRLVLSWMLVTAALTVVIDLTRPSDYLLNAAVDLLLVLAAYTIVPAPLRVQTLPAVLFSVAVLGVLYVDRDPLYPDALGSISVAFVAANVLGFVASRRLHRSQRVTFLALEKERQAVVDLERAVAELETLRGIIPVCMHCRRVRDEEGAWEQVEVYVSRHSLAEFSHGICPDCAEEWEEELGV